MAVAEPSRKLRLYFMKKQLKSMKVKPPSMCKILKCGLASCMFILQLLASDRILYCLFTCPTIFCRLFNFLIITPYISHQQVTEYSCSLVMLLEASPFLLQRIKNSSSCDLITSRFLIVSLMFILRSKLLLLLSCNKI